jgi:predicted NAD-dependent protein-ADP-ribosyltransferase YbiA (DUF1768 family)
MSERKWFVAEAVFHVSVMKQANVLQENLLFLVEDVDHSSAVIKAEAIAKAKEHGYDNEKGQRVNWTFVRLVEVTEMIDQRFQDGAELKSIMRDETEG